MSQTTTVRQTSFSIGEVDITNYKRTDFKDYLNAAQSLINIEVGSTGLAKKRKGTQAELLSPATPTKLMPSIQAPQVDDVIPQGCRKIAIQLGA